jgi:peptide/nickel transport system ATP-binding protein
MPNLLEIRNLTVIYGGDVPIRAVDNVSLTIASGEIVGLAGESGSGKSTLAMALTRVLPDSAQVSGAICFQGQNIIGLSGTALQKLRWAGISLVTQSAMNALNPVLSVSEQITDVILDHHSMGPVQARAKVVDLLNLVDLPPSVLHSYPHQLSGGMRQRVMIAMALALDPALVIFDEPTTALDVVVQAQLLHRIKHLQTTLGFAMLFITHDLSLLLALATRIAVMYAGQIVEEGPADDIRYRASHPYTDGLIASFPSVAMRRKLVGIPGSPPSMAKPPPGCRFHPRCPRHIDICNRVNPEPVLVTQRHWAACHLLSGASAQALRKEADHGH